MRRATAADLPAIRAHLLRHLAGSMFPLANLDAHGIDGTAPRGLRLWLGDGGVVGVTNEGMLMPQWPDGADWADFARVCPGPLTGAAGPGGQVRAALDALDLGQAPRRLDADEAHLDLPLTDLRLPEVTGLRLSAPRAADVALLQDWRAAYHVEVLGTPAEAATGRAADDVAGWIAADSHRLLWQGDRPVALTGFNATAAGAVQVGGVFTPPPLRDRGHARAAVALHLDEVRRAGRADRAILFTTNPAALRAYQAIGFRRIGTYALVLFDGPQAVRHG